MLIFDFEGGVYQKFCFSILFPCPKGWKREAVFYQIVNA
jgi:hypothetical protein